MFSLHLHKCLAAAAFGLCALASPQTGLADQKTVMVLGDSLSQGLGAAISRCFKTDAEIQFVQKGKLNSGLTKKQPVDWVSEASDLAKEKPAVAVVQIGANDIIPLNVSGKFAPFGSDDWKAEYSRRVASIVSAFSDAGSQVYWVGLPYPERSDFQDPYHTINSTISGAVPADKAKFYDIWESFQVDGKYSSYGMDINNTKTLIRADDGVHFTAAGYTREAALLVPDIAAKLSIANANCAQ